MTTTPEALPPLPEPDMTAAPCDADGDPTAYYRASTVRAYARAALAAPQPLDESALAVALADARMVERERCAAVVRYWLGGLVETDSYERRCLAHILEGRPAPAQPTKD